MKKHANYLTKNALVSHMNEGWGKFLFRLGELSESEIASYLKAQGYRRLQDLLAHVLSWWEETLRVVPILSAGGEPNYDWKDVDDFNLKAINTHKDKTLGEITEQFETVRGQFTELVRNLSEQFLFSERIYEWICNGVVEHYEEHRPPQPSEL